MVEKGGGEGRGGTGRGPGGIGGKSWRPRLGQARPIISGARKSDYITWVGAVGVCTDALAVAGRSGKICNSEDSKTSVVNRSRGHSSHSGQF
ncbi:hypothetical protein PoB_002052500 [Plakobranchus ocellatus]|uniref:Uncharacterized protein n=1 Tax=Plakobranchus ocellatus TaxID=259542 RepID=A0AAV3ZFU4_9GAST|nr:hypothetical protein PoB_002052500 [Plakobranchus ocellatus]